MPMHRDTREGKGSGIGNIQHLRERNGRDSLGGPQPPKEQEECGTKGLFRRVQENCWSVGLKLVCPPPKMIAVSSTSRPWLLFSRCTSDRPSHLFHRELGKCSGDEGCFTPDLHLCPHPRWRGMESQGDELSANETLGHGSEHAKPSPFPDAQ